MTLSSKTLAVLVVVILFGGILLSSSLGVWSTETSKQAAAFTTGEFTGQANPADIRGSYTLADIEKNFGISLDILVKAFGIQTDDPAGFTIKELETLFADSPVEIGTSSVRLFVAFYKGLPFDLSTEIFLPKSAVDMLVDKPLSAEQKAYLQTHTAGGIVPSSPAAVSPTQAAQATNTETASSDRLIKGLTTFKDLLSWSLTNETIEKVLGLPLPSDLSVKVKDFTTANNLSFETVKSELQAAVDALK